MKVTFDTEKKYVTRPEESKTITSVTIFQIMDDYREKKVTALTKELGMIVLFSDDKYTEVGQWTDEDVENRIKELVNN